MTIKKRDISHTSNVKVFSCGVVKLDSGGGIYFLKLVRVK